jgi:hypothetical protein
VLATVLKTPDDEVDEYLRALAEMAEASGGGIADPVGAFLIRLPAYGLHREHLLDRPRGRCAIGRAQPKLGDTAKDRS